MFQMLVSKLGGLINRRVYHLPFSRTVKLDQPGVEKIHRMFQECMETRGTLLVQPEHLLSFGLMGLECLLSERLSIGESMLQTQAFLDDNARDIVDESDENLSVKFELMYTMGLQRPIEMSPDRWTIIQRILGMLPRFAMDVKKLLPDSLEIDDRLSGRFPKIRILRDDATEALLDSLASHICTQGFTGFPIGRQHTSMREAVRRYIREPKLSVNDIDQVEKGIFWTDTTKNTLLLVRGLIAGGVLRFVLGSKRWRVNFGIDINRSPKTMLAVPFRSKDCPSPRSEFSHPDVVIVLTSLAYYYGGLDEVNFFDTFARLLTSDRPDIEYGDWIAAVAHAIPTSFRQLSGVNIKDRAQCLEKLFPVLRYSKGMIDFFLGNLVFPREMKEFPHKLSASGWNLGKVKKHPLTGFSGTNDSRHLLPLSVQHLDLSTQKHTNALVLEYLLRDENSVRILGSRAEFMGSDAENLLRVVQTMSPPTRVILDVGAQILELNNNQVAEKWLQMSDDEHTKAVVFFSNDEELSVLDRRGHVELLNESPFSKQLGDCLIYLDEAHTRGTDLKLPTEYRAAVTLGPHLTKDRLVQGMYHILDHLLYLIPS